MSHATRLDKASSYLFLLGFFISKIQYIPILIIAPFIKTISLILYFLAYSLWFIAGFIYPDHKKKNDEWYGFAQLKEQYQLAAVIGLAATVLSILALFVPILTLPAVWIFFVSNIIWIIGEYHKLNNPPQYELNYSHGHQNAYLSYAITMTLISLLTAISTSIILIVPPIAIPVFIIATLLSVGMGALAGEFVLDYNFGNHPLTPIKNSYDQMIELLDTSIVSEMNDNPEPYHQNHIFTPTEQPSKELIPDSSDLTCKASL